jgi:hypothetical protein
MKKKDVPAMLRRIGIPMAYDHFAEGEAPKPPFCVYLYPRSDNFAADGKAYFKQDILHVEIYTNKKDLSLEDRAEAVFDEYGLFYAKSEVWIQSERLYEVLYQMEV